MKKLKKLPSRLLSGPPLIGFMTAFDSASGDPDTEWPYPVVTPSAVGPALLPFACPHCGEVCSEIVDPNTREHYYDKLRKFSWCPCPDCHGRFFVDRKGMPLSSSLPAGAILAPSRVERDGEVSMQADVKVLVAPSGEGRRFDMLGAI